MAWQKRAIKPASTESVLVRKSSLLANPLIRAGLTILTVNCCLVYSLFPSLSTSMELAV